MSVLNGGRSWRLSELTVKSDGWSPLQERTPAMIFDVGAIAWSRARETVKYGRGATVTNSMEMLEMRFGPATVIWSHMGHTKCVCCSARSGWVNGCKDALGSWEQRYQWAPEGLVLQLNFCAHSQKPYLSGPRAGRKPALLYLLAKSQIQVLRALQGSCSSWWLHEHLVLGGTQLPAQP